MKSTLIAAAIGILVTSSIGAIGYGAVLIHDAHADSRYVQQETFKRSVDQQRIWTLEDRTAQIRSKANAENRGLTTFEQTQVKKNEEQLKSLRGW